MKKTIKKYGKYLTSFAGLSVLLSMPLAALAVTDQNLTDFVGGVNTTGGNVYSTGGTDNALVTWIGKAVGIVIGFLGIILVLYIIWAGFTWMTAGGDAKKVEDAKTKIKNAVIGIIIVFAAYAITTFVIANLTKVTGT